jgi:hypothetical protein
MLTGGDRVETVEPAAAKRVLSVVRRITTALTWAGVLLGVFAGIVQLAYGSSIPAWTGDKNDTVGLGLVTIGLSLVAGVALWRLLRPPRLWGQIICAVTALACAVVCFTTVGRLWYLPGPLLVLATGAGLWAARAQSVRHS